MRQLDRSWQKRPSWWRNVGENKYQLAQEFSCKIESSNLLFGRRFPRRCLGLCQHCRLAHLRCCFWQVQAKPHLTNSRPASNFRLKLPVLAERTDVFIRIFASLLLYDEKWDAMIIRKQAQIAIVLGERDFIFSVKRLCFGWKWNYDDKLIHNRRTQERESALLCLM